MIEIIEFEDKYKEDFRRLNLEWLEKYHLLEPHDQLVIDNPKSTIIDKGGYIFLAKLDNEMVGSAGLSKEHENEYELVKMAVAPAFRGKGISKLLMEKCLEKAKAVNAKKIMLYSNSQLQTAITLYRKYGFYHVPVINAPFVTADVKMELDLQQ
ncbi:MAG: GNAT family N-acetyltransferase [Bacteroidetes bacterium]|nr:GNAT family N-acetyltransferase [Bacteroidota bacterium]MBS1973274.1 GNAT family N-acetyltransferase [Bacteroidota bacterium]